MRMKIESTFVDIEFIIVSDDGWLDKRVLIRGFDVSELNIGGSYTTWSIVIDVCNGKCFLSDVIVEHRDFDELI